MGYTQIDISQGVSAGYRISSNGEAYPDSLHTLSDYVEATPGGEYRLTAHDSGNSPLYVELAFYTTQKAFISRPIMTASDGWDDSSWDVIAPNNAAYIRVSAPTSTYENALILSVESGGGCFYE